MSALTSDQQVAVQALSLAGNQLPALARSNVELGGVFERVFLDLNLAIGGAVDPLAPQDGILNVTGAIEVSTGEWVGNFDSGVGNTLDAGVLQGGMLGGNDGVLETSLGSLVLGGTAGQIYESITPAPEPWFYQDGEGVVVLGGINNIVDMSLHENDGAVSIWAANGILLGTDNLIITDVAGLACFAAVIVGGEQHEIRNSFGYDGIFAGASNDIFGSASVEANYAAHNGILAGKQNRIGATNLTAKHEHNVILGGQLNRVLNTGIFLRGAATIGGQNLQSRLRGQVSHGCNTTSFGQLQTSMLFLSRATTDGTPTELTTDGRGIVDADNRFTLEDQATYLFEIHVVARRIDADDESAAYTFVGAIDRQTGVGTTALVGAVAKTVIHEDNGAWDVNVTADAVNGSLKVEVTGADSVRWGAFVRLTQAQG